MKLAKVIYDDTEKLAGELGKYLAFGLAGSGITIGTGLTIDAMHKIKKKNKEKKTWAAIKKRYPEFNNPDSKELFESMYDVNPTEMKHIPFIIPALKQAKEYSTEGAPTQLVSELARMEGTHRAGKPDLVDRVMRGYESGLATVKAVDDISFTIKKGHTLGIVGESGSGKSTTGFAILRLNKSKGKIFLGKNSLNDLDKDMIRHMRKRMQIIFQDPFSSLDPRMTAEEIVGELLKVHGNLTRGQIREKVEYLFERVGLREDQLGNYPHEFSGGQRQRLGIARALSLDPDVIVCDEPVSALDVSIQAQVINLLLDLQDELGVAYLFVAHDLAVVEHISDRVAVMYLGRIVEIADRDRIFLHAQHPYTESLLNAVPVPDPTVAVSRRILQGDVPSPVNRPSGCHFHTRCPYATEKCRTEVPTLKEIFASHEVACHLR